MHVIDINSKIILTCRLMFKIICENVNIFNCSIEEKNGVLDVLGVCLLH
jgi:hypothetical protein